MCMYLGRAYDTDRFMAPDIDAVTELLKANKVWLAVRHHIEHYHRVQVRHGEARQKGWWEAYVGD